MRLEDAISLTPYIHSGAEYVRGDARIERPMPHASGRRYLCNPVHTQQSRVCARECEDRETHAPMRLEDAISVTPYIHSGAEYVQGDARIESPMPHASGRRYLRNPVHTQRSGVCAGECKDRETHAPCVWKTLSL